MIDWKSLGRAAGSLIRGTVGIIAFLFFAVEDLFWAVMKPIMGAIARIQWVRRVEAWLDGLSPHWFLTLFIVPLVVVWPFKLAGLALVGTGRVISGTIMFIIAEIVGAAVAVRLWAIGRDRLLTIGWFAVSYRVLMDLRSRVYGWAGQLPAVQAARLAFKSLRDRSRRLWADLVGASR